MGFWEFSLEDFRHVPQMEVKSQQWTEQHYLLNYLVCHPKGYTWVQPMGISDLERSVLGAGCGGGWALGGWWEGVSFPSVRAFRKKRNPGASAITESCEQRLPAVWDGDNALTFILSPCPAGHRLLFLYSFHLFFPCLLTSQLKCIFVCSIYKHMYTYTDLKIIQTDH